MEYDFRTFSFGKGNQPELFPLAHGVSKRVGKLRGAGNSIVPQVAAVFIRAFMEATQSPAAS